MTHKEQHIVLSLSEHFKNSVLSRAAVINLFDIDFSKAKTVEIDFSTIDFVSRSATHQLIKEKERLEKTLPVKVNFLNLNKKVKEMFEVVSKSIETPKPQVSTIHRVHFSTPKEFQSFLLHI